jgi:hypothetical protein
MHIPKENIEVKIELQESEIKDALRQYMGTHYNLDLDGQELSVTLTAGRGANGHYATLQTVDGHATSQSMSKESPFVDTDDDIEPSDSAQQPIAFDI